MLNELSVQSLWYCLNIFCDEVIIAGERKGEKKRDLFCYVEEAGILGRDPVFQEVDDAEQALVVLGARELEGAPGKPVHQDLGRVVQLQARGARVLAGLEHPQRLVHLELGAADRLPRLQQQLRGEPAVPLVEPGDFRRVGQKLV